MQSVCRYLAALTFRHVENQCFALKLAYSSSKATLILPLKSKGRADQGLKPHFRLDLLYFLCISQLLRFFSVLILSRATPPDSCTYFQRPPPPRTPSAHAKIEIRQRKLKLEKKNSVRPRNFSIQNLIFM